MTGFYRQAPRFRSLSRLSASLLLPALGLLVSAPSLALDGAVSARRSNQEGRAGEEKYRQTQTQIEGSANQLLPLAAGFGLRFDGRLNREEFDSRFGSATSSFERRTGQAGVSLDLHRRQGNFRLGALGFDQEYSGSATDFVRQERRTLQTSGDYRRGWVRLNTGLNFTSSRREFRSGDRVRDQEWSGFFSKRSSIPRIGDLGYRFSALIDRNPDFDTRTRQTTHTVDFASITRFAGGRGQAALKTTSTFFTLKEERQGEEGGARLQLPHSGSLFLDDTPEVSDPLEGEGTPVPELYDGNRQDATEVQIGDAAPAVREFGGDFRNIQFDFGEAIDIVSAILYIDRTLVFPQMFRWRVFFSNDAEGRLWEEASGVEVVYREWGVGLQGWSVVLAQPVQARFFKLVDVKLGPTIPELSVTELEVSARREEATDQDTSRTDNHRIGASLDYQVSPALRTGYDLYYRRRNLTGPSSALEDRGHTFRSAWNRGIWSVSGRYELRTLEGRRSRNTDVNSQTVSVTRGPHGAFASTLFWTRVQDHSTGTEKTSNSLSLGYTWPAAPSLRIDQRITGARLRDRAGDRTSRSLIVVTSITGDPVPALSLDLQQSERWVSQEAGAGFSRFGDTALTIGWRPVPLVLFQSLIRYELRDKGDWLTRYSVNWDPLSEGDLKVGLGAHHFRDTRASETQRGGGLQLEWKARPSLTFLGSVQAVRLEAASQENSPLNTEIKGIWRF
jgi:hypothetical protein